MIQRNTIFTNVALRPDGTPWWEGHDDPAPAEALDWQGRPWTPASTEKAAHPNSRFTTPATQVRDAVAGVRQPERRADRRDDLRRAPPAPHPARLRRRATGSTARSSARRSRPRRRPPRPARSASCAAIRWRCGRSAATTWGTTSSTGSTSGAKLTNPPQIFRVNWFRTSEAGRFLWPGFGDNLRVLKWILDRCDGRGSAVETAIGAVPTPDAIDRTGLNVTDADMADLLKRRSGRMGRGDRRPGRADEDVRRPHADGRCAASTRTSRAASTTPSRRPISSAAIAEPDDRFETLRRMHATIANCRLPDFTDSPRLLSNRTICIGGPQRCASG